MHAEMMPGMYSVVVGEQGQVWTFGSNRWMQVGQSVCVVCVVCVVCLFSSLSAHPLRR